MTEFQEFPKIARLSRECVITEKIDGTNGQICIVREAEDQATRLEHMRLAVAANDGLLMLVGSRTQFITPERDNHGFGKWVLANAAALWALGEGRHFGEWWGSGIQRGYGLSKGEKRFSLFNVARWHQAGSEPYISASGDPRIEPKRSQQAPDCCGVVPILYRGDFQTSAVDFCVQNLRDLGSKAAAGFMKPEGVIVYHVAANSYFKKTLEKDAEPKRFAAVAV